MLHSKLLSDLDHGHATADAFGLTIVFVVTVVCRASFVGSVWAVSSLNRIMTTAATSSLWSMEQNDTFYHLLINVINCF